MVSIESHSYTINGIKVQFPCKAYPSQLSMMDKIIKGIDRHQNCLLESPTGSGKSLALLCSALAWQTHERERIKKEENHVKDSCCSCVSKTSNSKTLEGQSAYFISTNQPLPSGLVQSPVREETSSCVQDIEDDDFRVDMKKIRGVHKPQIPVNGEIRSGEVELTTLVSPEQNEEMSCCCQCNNQPSNSNKKRVPKIYFGTRTHKQIAQIAKELGKTAYRHTRMTILGSREHTCVDPEVSRLPNKNEECKTKLDGAGCRYFDGVRKISHRSISDKGLSSAWNLEQFIGVCKKQRACPYFAARQLKDSAEIIFCPYNYLIDPLIRESMEINLRGQVVILDEAHNIEDSTRDAASFSITQTKLKDAMSDVQTLINESVKPKEHKELYNMLNSFNEFIISNEDGLEGDYEHASRVWSGLDIVATLTHTGVGPGDFRRLQECFQVIAEDEAEKRESGVGIKLKAATLQCFSGLFMVLGYIYRNDMKYLNDYKVAVVRSMEYGYPSSSDTQQPTANVWIQRKKRGSKQLTLCYTLHFWCLNPAVAFSDISEATRSIVLTSGTLSPMNTFQSELSAPFPIQLEANHIITDAQVWVGTISHGPRGGSLLGSYQNSETYTYQDEVGDVVLRVCQTIPHGVLCFLPSYKSMEKLTTRWKNTGLWQRLMQYKSVMVEPRASDKMDFDVLIKQYYDLISDNQTTDGSELTGALFIAVCRGKVSEGLDFADNNARAVITVGIPFPNIKDTQIELKKQYNDHHSAERGLLRGRDWYEIQAYRAINQALGRCIRHRNDWGALILVDERYGKNPQRYIKGLSKWVRKRVQYYNTFQQAEQSLKEFTKERLENASTVNNSMVSVDISGINSTVDDLLETSTVTSDVTEIEVSANQSYVGTNITNYFTPDSRRKHSSSPAVRKHSRKTDCLANRVGHNSANQKMDSLANQKTNGLSIDERTAVANQQAVGTPSARHDEIIVANNINNNKNIPARYLNPSQAGGFIPSQMSTSEMSTSTNPVLNELNPLLTQTQAGHRTQCDQELLVDGDPAVDFKPTITSTQAVVKVPHDVDVPNGASMTVLNTQHILSVPTDAKVCDVQDSGSKDQTDGDVRHRPGADRCDDESGKIKETTDAADSPTLFDSDDESKQKLDGKKLSDALSDLHTGQQHGIKLDDDSVNETEHGMVVTHKPIFKKRKSMEHPDGTPSSSNASRRRLSLCKLRTNLDHMDSLTESKDSEETSHHGPTESKAFGDICHDDKPNESKPTRQFEDNTVMNSKVLREKPDNGLNSGQDNLISKLDFREGKKVVKQAESDFEVLNVKRARGKKRRSSHHGNVRMTRRKGVHFSDEDDDDDDDTQLQVITFSCPQCKTKLATLSGYSKESYRPAFVKMISSSTSLNPIVGDLVTVNKEQLPDTGRITVITSQDPCLNSFWSSDDDCVIQYVTCEKCTAAQRSSGTGTVPCLGARVLMMGKPSPRLKAGQVWLLPHGLTPSDTCNNDTNR